MDIKYFITDVDGVVFDTMPDLISAFVKVMRPLGITEGQVVSNVTASLGAPLEFQIKNMAAETGKSISPVMVQTIIKNFWAALEDQPLKLFPGVKETLAKIKSQGLTVLASSGSNTDVLVKAFREFNLPYDLILGSDKILKGDGHIDEFAKYCLSYKNDFCRQAAFIGDGTVDMEIASRNSILGIGITNSLSEKPLRVAGANAIISNFSQVLEFIK